MISLRVNSAEPGSCLHVSIGSANGLVANLQETLTRTIFMNSETPTETKELSNGTSTFHKPMISQYIKACTKWPTFWKPCLQIHYVRRKIFAWKVISVYPEVPMNNNLELVQAMAWCGTDKQPVWPISSTSYGASMSWLVNSFWLLGQLKKKEIREIILYMRL